MRRNKIIYGIVFVILLLVSSWFHNVSAYANDYDEYDYNYNDDYNNYNYSNDDNDDNDDDQYDYNFWENYWKNKNQYNNENNENQLENQNEPEPEQNDLEKNKEKNKDEDKDEDEPRVDMTYVTLKKNSVSGVLVDNGDWIRDVEFKIKVNSEVVLNKGDNAEVSIESSNEDMYFYADLTDNILTISTSSPGKTNLKVIINEKEFDIKVKVTLVGFNKNSYIISKGKEEQILIKGGKNLKIKWKSSKPDIVSVSQDGRVKGLKEGNAIITAEINGNKLAAIVSSVSEIKKKAVNWAIDYSNKSEYSQPKRMQEGYYDCSALVWRAYNKFGHKLAGLNYAPTAAELCRNYDSKKQTIKGGISWENIERMKLLPGDLVFVSGNKNGRYKNIYHVEMIAGYDLYGVDEKGHPSVMIRYVKSQQYTDKATVARVSLR